jgi:hypothetical protein
MKHALKKGIREVRLEGKTLVLVYFGTLSLNDI